ncbi:BglG family transcription antiterminator [Streptococcus merionis]|uniref:Phosphotransferase n=1 Tax=Streptococcus merionis TaxID=400065 RepID=A0A239SVR1_9STRE|nr:transcription antiterminator [Streptococcus merionis]SNU89322.1 phosphotransferase [Streptococcus merionis]
MLFLDKDSYALLTYLLSQDEPETIMAISKTLGQSRRKIYYSLEKVNEALPESVGPIVSVPRIGVQLTPEQKAACQELLAELDDYSYVMSMEERIQLLLVYILVSPERVTLERMMALTDVSRNTTLNDLNAIRERLSQEYRYLPLVVTKSQGYFINSHLLDKIQYIYSLLFTIFTSSNNSFLAIFEKKMRDLSGSFSRLEDDRSAALLQQFHDMQKVWGKEMYHSDIKLMVRILPYILLSYRNSQLTSEEREDVVKELGLVRKRIEYKIAQRISLFIKEQYRLELDDIEQALIGILLLSSRKNYDSHINTLDFRDVEEAIEVFLQDFEKNTHYQFVQRADLAQRLLIHCKALIFRKTYGILSKNPLTAQIKEKYGSLFEATTNCVDVLEKAWMIQLTDDDIAHLAVHLGGALRSIELQRSPERVCIVCDQGVPIQRLLVRQVEYHFPSVTVTAVFTTEQFKSVEDILEVDALIQTNDSLESQLPSVQVSPILNREDILAIGKILRHPNPLQNGKAATELRHLIETYIPDGDKQAIFKAKLQKLIQDNLMMGLILEDL